MKTKITFGLGLLAAVCGLSAHAQGNGFTYQGRLNDGLNPANGIYDLTFALFPGNSGAGQVGSTLTSAATPVSNGLFTVVLDFGANFPGADRWLELAVRTNGGGAFTTLSPRQKVTPTPYAITASNLSGSLSGAQIANGTVTAAAVDGTQVQLRVNGTAPAGQFITGVGSDGSVTVASDTTDWKLNGNEVSPGQFLGSTNRQPLEIKVNNVRALRLEPDPRVGNDAANLIGGHPANQIELPDSGGSVIVGGGYAGGGNIIRSNSSGVFIGAGSHNAVGPNASDVVIAGGNGNQAQSFAAAIGGGYVNRIATNAAYAVVAGGGDNAAQSYGSTIGGGIQNRLGTNSAYAVIAGGTGNRLESQAATIGGGVGNTNTGYAGTVAGGFFNTAANNGAAVGGGGQNIATGFNAVVAGGNNNLASAENAAVGGGLQNTNRGYAASIGGGVWNQATNNYATVPGGVLNLAGGSASFAAGSYAKATHNGAFVWGDSTGAEFSSVADNEFAVRASGGVRFVTTGAAVTLNGQPVLTPSATNALNLNNPANLISGAFTGDGASVTNVDAATLDGLDSTILWQLTGNAVAPGQFLGSANNQALELKVNSQRRLLLDTNANVVAGAGSSVSSSGVNAAGILSGSAHQIRSNAFGSVIAGGQLNTVSNADHAVIAGGLSNTISNSSAATISGGAANVARGFGATIGGGTDNAALSDRAAVAGGTGNTAIGDSAFIGGGFDNRTQNGSTTIAGGTGNFNNSAYGFIGGGQSNSIPDAFPADTLGGGQNNSVSGGFSFLGGGEQNRVQSTADHAALSGGFSNLVSGDYASIPGGRQNTAGGDYAFAAGRQAKANHQGTFVWADAQNTDFASTRTNQFAVRAQNGVVIQAATNGTALELRTGGALKVTGAGLGTGTPVFIHRAVAATISFNTTIIDHPLSNNDPNAILIVTPNWNPGGSVGVYNTNPIGVYYVGNRWAIFNQNSVGMVTNSAYNVLVVKP